ncbi:hypothetical protein ABBQ38_003880 [Trebouxia sp. C0009 RCD-2024]
MCTSKPAALDLLCCLAIFGVTRCRASGAPDFVYQASDLQPWLYNVFSQLHQAPELSFEETATSSLVQSQLQQHNIAFIAPIAKTGVIASVGDGSPVVYLRADMDALPISEEMSHLLRSKHEGIMHACGHDAHTTMLLGAAILLKSVEMELPGTVKFLFQPAEEAAGSEGMLGAQKMLQMGLLDDASAFFGLHVDPSLPTGTFATAAGPIFASEVNFQATLYGTMRTLSTPVQKQLQLRLEQVLQSQSSSCSCSATLDWRLRTNPPYPVLVNDAQLSEMASQTASSTLGSARVTQLTPYMVAEDFAYYAQQAPVCFSTLGIYNESAGSVHALHSPRFKVDPEVLQTGAAMHAALAWDYLHTHAMWASRSGPLVAPPPNSSADGT